ncbi:MAG: helix-turn-helix domain-containing protein [Candidatus Eremiobacteraeota bacterium]|nr:helix-turn-helix domain-containing protein [Candidatus Eremiobacteraeota bacterium]
MIDSYVIDTLMADLVGHDKMPSAFIVYLFLWRRTDAARRRGVALSLRAIAEGTGLSKRAVQLAVARLVKRDLVEVSRSSATAVARYSVMRPWRRRSR